MTLIRVGGRLSPRRFLWGSFVRAAQSRGEWPGPNITLREGRRPGASVLLVAANDTGVRKVAAADTGVGRRIEDDFGFGGARNS